MFISKQAELKALDTFVGELRKQPDRNRAG